MQREFGLLHAFPNLRDVRMECYAAKGHVNVTSAGCTALLQALCACAAARSKALRYVQLYDANIAPSPRAAQLSPGAAPSERALIWCVGTSIMFVPLHSPHRIAHVHADLRDELSFAGDDGETVNTSQALRLFVPLSDFVDRDAITRLLAQRCLVAFGTCIARSADMPVLLDDNVPCRRTRSTGPYACLCQSESSGNF